MACLLGISFSCGGSILEHLRQETWFPKYFEYTYGIHASEHLKVLVEKGYAFIESAFDSLDHINATMKKAILKKKESRACPRWKRLI
ncbi:MAG: hypothetical protein ACLVJN_04435 [Streptococcus parasanguinis]